VTRYTLAIDPDTHTTGWAVACLGTLRHAGVVVGKRKATGGAATTAMAVALESFFEELGRTLDGPVRLVIEDQEITKYRKARPSDILRLSRVAGMIEGAARRHLVVAGPTRWLTPSRWTNSLPKHIHQGRALTAFGYRYTKEGSGKSYRVVDIEPVGASPSPFTGISNTDIVHTLDAVSMLHHVGASAS
jgi:hypothetical protein